MSMPVSDDLGSSTAGPLGGMSATGPAAVFPRGTGDVLLWVPVLICVALMLFVWLATAEASLSGDEVPARVCGPRISGDRPC